MDIIWMGVLLAIGWYLMPLIVMLVLSIISLPFVIIGKLFEK